LRKELLLRAKLRLQQLRFELLLLPEVLLEQLLRQLPRHVQVPQWLWLLRTELWLRKELLLRTELRLQQLWFELLLLKPLLLAG